MTKNEIKKANEYRSLFPREISVKVQKYEEGFVAEITTFPGCFTQASSYSELIDMVNDAVRVYFEVPKKYLPLMLDYKPPVSEATRLGLIPPKELKLEIRNGSEIAC